MLRGRWFFDVTGVPILLLGLLVVAFLGIPLAGLVFNLSGSDIARTLGDPQTRGALVTSVLTASVSTIIIGCLGVPLAYLLARYRFPGRRLVSVLVFLPLVLPPVSAGILLIMVYGPYGMVGHLFDPHGIDFVDTASGIVIAQIFVSAPFVIVAARSAFEHMEPDYEEAAASMGATTWQTFWHVALPVARGGILAGITLGWMRCLGEFGATVIMAYHPYTLPVLNFVNLDSTGLAQALPLALLALIIACAVLLVLFFLEQVDWGARLTRP